MSYFLKFTIAHTRIHGRIEKNAEMRMFWMRGLRRSVVFSKSVVSKWIFLILCTFSGDNVMWVTPYTSVVFIPNVIFRKSISCLMLVPDVDPNLWIVK